MNLTKHPRLLARVAGVFYLALIVSAMWSYRYVRGELIVGGDMTKTVANIVAHQQLYRMGISAAVVTMLCDTAMGALLYQLLKLVSPRLAALAFAFFAISVAVEAVDIFNYIAPLFTVTLPEYRAAFSPTQLQALVRGSVQVWVYGLGVALAFFGAYCLLAGYLIFRSKFLPSIFGVLMMVAGVYYLTDNFSMFLKLPAIPFIGMLHPTLVIECALALWLVLFGVNEAKWREWTQAMEADGTGL